MVFDMTIGLGNVLTIAAFIVSITLFISSIRTQGKLIDLRLSAIERSNEHQSVEIKKLAEVLVVLGRYEERFLRLEGMIDDLRHGRGVILKDS